ncbi:MAG: ribbon-helix-helix protein, CopG family [Beijerinckiaceae bacterium]|nr:ribbon-helix-helix protein, CopG family [Beijerinckiaceae bacterium]
MAILKISLPDDIAKQLKSLAQNRGLSVNKLVEEISVQAVAVWDTETHFRRVSARVGTDAALAVLDRLDAADRG